MSGCWGIKYLELFSVWTFRVGGLSVFVLFFLDIRDLGLKVFGIMLVLGVRGLGLTACCVSVCLGVQS